jgi:hypothetical protein
LKLGSDNLQGRLVRNIYHATLDYLQREVGKVQHSSYVTPDQLAVVVIIPDPDLGRVRVFTVSVIEAIIYHRHYDEANKAMSPPDGEPIPF